jgi:glycosyltransferase involved in cell wall biosynthesis
LACLDPVRLVAEGTRPGSTFAPTAPGPEARASGIRRLTVVISELGPGGAERLVVHLVAGLRRRGVEAGVVTLREEGVRAGELRPFGAPVHALHSHRGYDLGAVARLHRLLARERPDVLNVHDRWSLPYVVLANLVSLRRPIVFSAHGLMFGEPERAGVRYRLAARHLAAVTAVSEEVARRHARYLGWPGPVDVVPNGVPPVCRAPDDRLRLRAELKMREGAFVFLSVGNVRPEKGFEDLLSAAAELRASEPSRPFVALIAGRIDETPYAQGLLAEQRRLELGDCVRFLGFRGDVEALYAAADALVLSSRSEGLPMVVLEGMMAGLPVVATRVGGVPTAVEGCGLLVDAARPDEMARAMRRLMAEPSLAANLGARAARRAADRYGVERMAADYLEVYRRVASRRDRHNRR